MASPHVYLIPGLGADHRVFETLHLQGFETTVIYWETPLTDESITDYVRRLSVQVKHDEIVFIGYSFGGIIGAELTKLFPASRLVLVSSIATRKELPWWLRLGGAIRLNRLLSGKYMKRRNAFARWFFSLQTDYERKLFDDILRDSDPVFLKWAVNIILNWKGNGSHRLHHIHGKKDRLLPLRFTSADIVVEGGGHFMIVSDGKQVSEILLTILKTLA